MFKPVPTDRISNLVIEQIKEAVFQKRLKPGDKLPSERQLMDQFKTSRVTIREALRSLEHFGIIEIKRGVDGGAFIRDPNTKLITNFLQDMFLMGKIKISDMTEARLAIEPYSVRLATERMTEDALNKISQNIQEAKECLEKDNKEDARLLNLEFHRLIAQTSQNPVIIFMMDSIMDIMENNISSIPLSIKTVEKTIQYHNKIYLTLKGKNANRAQDLMLEHIGEIQKALEGLDKSPIYKRRSNS
jgi:DNA-binding FadR family transcriptional regulator